MNRTRDELVLYGRQALCAGAPQDDALCVTLLRASDDREATARLLIDYRNRWRTYQTVQQRKWQVRSKHTHHDSAAIRERYVRVSNH